MNSQPIFVGLARFSQAKSTQGTLTACAKARLTNTNRSKVRSGGEGSHGTSCILYYTYTLVVIVTRRLSDFMLYLKKRGGTNAKLEMNK